MVISLKVKMKTRGKGSSRVELNDDEVLIIALFRKVFFGSCCQSSTSRGQDTQPKLLQKFKPQRINHRLLPRAHGKGRKHIRDEKPFIMGARTVLSWLIKMDSISLNDTIELRSANNKEVVKIGSVTREGILCNCCSGILSISEFKAHAGFKEESSAVRLFLQSGKPYVLCQLEAWSTELKVRKNHLKRVLRAEEADQNDDFCALCGGDGKLVCCDNCPSTYHQSCMSEQELPEGSWYCRNCICMTCGEVAHEKESLISLALLECSQCGHKYHETCIKRRVPCNVEVGSREWFCKETCQEVYLGFRSRVAVVNHIDDGFSWTILRCSHVDQRDSSKEKLALIAECNAKLAISLTLMEECFAPMVDPMTGIDMRTHVLYNRGSKFARLNYQGFYAIVLEKGDVLVSVASIRVHGVTVAEMPFIATCGKHRRQGMARRLINAIEKLLISLKVKMLVISAIPTLVGTWTSGFGFKSIEDEEKEHLRNLISLNIETLVISTIPCSDETWTSCFGFIPIEDEEKIQLANDKLTKFSEAVLLEKKFCMKIQPKDQEES